MTAVDFAAFVERLAQVSSEVIMPFFRSAIRAEDKSKGGVFDPVTEADRAAEVATPGIAEALRCVLQKYLKDGNSSLMGHRAYDDPEGLTYR